jgi:hypothetical protein
MSTKIYTGFALPSLTTKQAMGLLGSLRPSIQALVDQKHRKLLAARIVEYVDGYVLARHLKETLAPAVAEREGKMAYFECTHRLQEEQEKCRGGMRREPLIDCDVELGLYMLPRSGKIIGIAYEERVGALEHLLSVPGVEEFAYFNNTDRPDELSAREWSRRARIWTQVLRDTESARFSMRWQPEPLLPRDMKPFIPSLDERAKKAAANYVTHTQLQKDWPIEHRDDFSGAMRVLRKVELALKDPASELSKEAAVLAARFTSLLVPDLSEHLMTKLGELPGVAELPPPTIRDADQAAST